MKSNKTHLTTREYVGEIVEVLSRPGFYKVKIPELTYFSKDGFIVYDESIKTRFTNSNYGSYGYFYPLQKGTKVVVRFKRDDLNSGIIEKVYSYEFPISNSKHPNYYLVVKTLSNTQIHIDDDSSELKFSFNADTNYSSYTPNGIKNHANNKYAVEATSKVDIKSPYIYLNGGVSVSGSSSNYSPSNNPVNYPININDPTVGEVVAINQNINGSQNKSARIDNKPEDITSTNISDSNIVNQVNILLNTDINTDQTLTYELTSLSDFNTNLSTKFDQIGAYINNYTNIFNSTKDEINNFLTPDSNIDETNYLQSNEDNILHYYFKLLNRHNTTVYYINQLLTSDDYTNLTDDQTDIVKSNIEYVYNVIKKSYNELVTMRSNLGRSDIIYLPNDLDAPSDTLTFDGYKTAFDYANYSKDTINNSTITSDISNLFGDIKDTIGNRLDYMINLSDIKYDIDSVYINTNNNSVINSITDELLDFKKKYYDTINNKTLNEILQHKLFTDKLGRYISEIVNLSARIDKISSKITNLKSTTTTFNILDKNLLDEITDITSITDIKSTIASKVSDVTVLLSELKNIDNYKDFFNKFDNIFQITFDINNNHLPTLKSNLLDKSHTIADSFKTILDHVICYNNKKNATLPKKYNSPVNNDFTLNNPLDDLFKKILELLSKMPDINIDTNLDISLSITDCLIDVDSLYDSAPDNIKPYLDNIYRKYNSLKSFLFQKYYKKLATLSTKTLGIIQSGNALYNSLPNYANKVLNTLNDDVLSNTNNNITKLVKISDIVDDENTKSSIDKFLVSNYKHLSPYLNPARFTKIDTIAKKELTLLINKTKIKYKFKTDLLDKLV
jgi:hypothetical protein